jgi:hypothetical protein
MAQSVSEVGRQVYKGTAGENTATITPISIAASTAIVMPAKPTANPGARGITSTQGSLEIIISIEGTGISRWTTNGITPTGAIGMLVPAPTATTPVQLTFRGQDIIQSLLIIGAGNTITYQFYTSDTAI